VAPNAVASPSLNSRQGQVIITLPPIAQGTPSPGQPALSSATRSIAGTVGHAKLGPIALSSALPQCSPSPAGLQCTVSVAVRAGTRPISLQTFATTDGTGEPLASSSGSVLVHAKSQTYTGSMTWTAILQRLRAVQTTPPLVQGLASTASFDIYGIDAGGAIAPSGSVTDRNGDNLATVSVYFSGPYLQAANVALGSSATFQYDGILAGSERMVASFSGYPVRPARISFPIAAGSTGSAQIFAQQANATYGSNPPNLFQFASGASGNVAPTRALSISAALSAAADDGSYWAVLTFGKIYALFNHYDASGNLLDSIPATYPGATPSNTPAIAAATVDAWGNAYVIDYLSGEPPVLNVYAPGGYHSAPVRSITIGTATYGYYAYVNPQIGADAAGDVFVGYSPCRATCGTESIFEYAAGASGTVAPSRTIAVGWLDGLAVDSSGIIYTAETSSPSAYLGNSQLNKYALDGTKTTIVSGLQSTTGGPQSSIIAVAIDRQANLYTSWIYRAAGTDQYQSEIEVYPPGTTLPSRTITGSATGFAPDAGLTLIEVAP
jgi:hypothetical protein